MAETATSWKEKGNEAFKEKKYHSAIRNYTRSLELQPDPLVFGNRAQAEINAELYILAQMDCTAAIQIDSKLPKAFYRRAQALKHLGLFEEASKDAERCLEFTSDAGVTSLLSSLKGKKNVGAVEVLPIERDEYLASSEKFTEVSISCDNIIEDEIVPCKKANEANTVEIKPIPNQPMSYADFASSVNYLEDQPEQLATYFLKIDTTRYHTLFDDLINDNIASQIIKSLSKVLENGRNENLRSEIAQKLILLSEVTRFDVIIMLMGIEEKNAISSICSNLSPVDAQLISAKFL